jgi:hypothetical protein
VTADAKSAWRALAAYAALVYVAMPFTSSIGLAFVATPLGGWLFGRGLVLGALVAGGIALGQLRRTAAPWPAYAGLGLVAGVGLVAVGRLAARPLERAHLPEYAVAAWLAWRALGASGKAVAVRYAGAFVLAASIGWGEELLQRVTPGRYFAWHDVGVNALGGALGLVLVASLSSGRRPPRSG